MRGRILPFLLALTACAPPQEDATLAVRRAALQEMVTLLEGPAYRFDAACIAVDAPLAVDGVHRPPEGFTGSLTATRLELRRFGDCLENPGLPGFTWKDASPAADAEVLVGVTQADSVLADTAVVYVLWLADGGEGEDYRCALRRGAAGWAVEACVLVGLT